MKTTFNLSIMLLAVITLAVTGCGGGGGGGNKSASLCANNSDSFICEVFKVVNNLTSETADPREIDSIAETMPEDAEPTTNI